MHEWKNNHSPEYAWGKMHHKYGPEKTLQSSPRAHAIYFRYTIRLSAVLFVDNSVISSIIVSDMCKLALLFTTGKQIYKPVVIFTLILIL